MKRVGVLIAVAAAFAVPGNAMGSPPAASAEVHDCNHWVHYPNMKISSARNMSCRRARGEMRCDPQPTRYRFTTRCRRFRCVRVSGMPLGGQWRCTKGRRAFRFEFGD